MADKEKSAGTKALQYSLVGGLVIVLVVALLVAVYFYIQYQNAQKILKNPNMAALQEVTDLTQKVGSLMILPKGEQPQIATVSDVRKLASDPFFANAKNGDKVLIYAQAREAILYDPMQNKIVAVGPVNVGTPTETPTPAVKSKTKSTPTTEPTATISAQ